MGVHFVELNGINVWSLEDFDLSDDHVLERIYELAGLLDFFWEEVVLCDQVRNSLVNLGLGQFFSENIIDGLSDLFDLGALGIGFLGLHSGVSLGEGNSENSHDKTVSSLHNHEAVNQGLPLFNHIV